MLRFCYWCLVRFHPSRFREHFAEEMLSIFDHIEGRASRGKLAADAFISLLRQWIMRPENWEQKATASIPIGATATPTFFTLGDFKPRKISLFYGAVLTLILYCGLFLILKHSRKHYVYMPAVLSESVVSLDALDSYAGVYVSDLPDKLTVSLTVKSGELIVETPREWKSALVSVPGNRFVFSDGQDNWIEFSKHGNGVIYGIRVHRNCSEFQAHRAMN
jgi:hypothetical protein